MQLLVSVRSAAEAREALAGGADIVDAKNPRRGPLGPVTLRALSAIRGVVPRDRPLSAALGDGGGERAVAGAAGAAARLGATYVKVGCAGVARPARAGAFLAAARRGAALAPLQAGLVAVAYADARRAGTVDAFALLDVAARAGAAGVLLDTALKDRGRLFELLTPDAVAAWVEAVHAASLFAALAGGLRGSDLVTAAEVGADISGVRGAACDGGRAGRVSRERVAALAALVRRPRAQAPV